MLRSLYAGVSGLRNHQTKLDVLGNNIANVNTVGFKSGRIIFSEAINQTITGASKNSGTGFINPVQVGLGMQVNTIDRMFQQGSLESTGNMTDLAIQGDGFFVLKGAESNYFTRAGNFFLNSDGQFVNQKGLAVQGRMLTGGATIGVISGANMEDIVIDDNIISEAQATENIWLSGNLDANLSPKTEVWTSASPFTTKANLTGSAVTVPLAVAAGANDEFNIEISGTGTPVNETLTLTANTYATVDDLVTEINAQIALNANLDGEIEAINDGGAVKFRALSTFSNTRVTLEAGTNDVLTDMGFVAGATDLAGDLATETTEINDLLQVSTALVTGDAIDLTGTESDGTDLTGSFTYGTDGTTVGSIVTSLSTSFTSATASLVDGQIVLTDDVAGDSETMVYLSGATGNTGEITIPSFSNTTEGFTGTVQTSIIVYDSLGGSHDLILEYEKTEVPGEWTWQISSAGDEEIVSGNSGRVVFDDSGALASFTYDDGADKLVISPGDGAALLSIAIHAEDTEDFSGLSQFAATSSLKARDQDGRATGQLIGLSIGREGILTGSFNNGETIDLAQLALAQFRNNNGLIDIGDGLNEVSISSGDAEIFQIGEGTNVSLISGALEMSNVDLSKEFTELITAQRGFQANAKVITTADQVLDELIRIKR